MIRGFDQQTAPLTEREKAVVPSLVERLSRAIGADKALCNQDLRLLHPDITSARLRKIINHIRNNSLVPCLIASSKGYYVAETEDELVEYEESLRGREEAIRAVRESISAQREDRFHPQMTLF